MQTFALKPTLFFGPDSLSALHALSGQRVLIVTDSFLASSPLAQRLKDALSGASECQWFDQVVPDPPLDVVAQGVAVLQSFQPQAIVAFGGGSPMDTAKGIRHFAPPELGSIPLWCVPTTAGTGSEVTSFAVLTDTAKGVKYPLVHDALRPDGAVLDPVLLAQAPPSVLADTGLDALTHAAEAYVAQNASLFTDALAAEAVSLLLRSIPGGVSGDLSQRGIMLNASCMAGMAFDRAGLGLCHALAHSLGGLLHVSHGRLNALLLPHVIRFNGQDGKAAAKYRALAKRCGLAESVRGLASGVSRLARTAGLPETLRACGKHPDNATLEKAVAGAMADPCFPSNPRTATAEELRALLEEIL